MFWGCKNFPSSEKIFPKEMLELKNLLMKIIKCNLFIRIGDLYINHRIIEEINMNNDALTLTDAQIITQVLNGDSDMFECLIERYKNYIFTVVSGHVPYAEVNEIAHVIFIDAYKALSGCRNRESFKSWLKSIALRKCYDYWRASYREKSRFVKDLGEEQKQWIESLKDREAFEQFREKGRLEEAVEIWEWVLNQLSPKERMVIKLIYFDELSIREAADLLGWSQINVKVQAFRCRRKLQKIFEKVSDGRVK